MEIFKNIPCDIVNYILSYDESFTIKNGKVHMRKGVNNKIDYLFIIFFNRQNNK
jgi:hypothetical protein